MRRLAIPMLSLLLLSGAAVSQQEKKPAALQVEKADSVRSVLARHVDKKVTLVLVQGTELTGTVKSVGDGVVHLSELSGREFYDAVVDLQKVSAVLVRVRGQ